MSHSYSQVPPASLPGPPQAMGMPPYRMNSLYPNPELEKRKLFLPTQLKDSMRFFQVPARPWWWGLIALAAYAGLYLLVMILTGVVMVAFNPNVLVDDATTTPSDFLVNNVAIAMDIAVCTLVAFIFFKQGFGWLVSVVGRMRWTWFFFTLMIFGIGYAVQMGIEVLLYGVDGYGFSELTMQPYTWFMIVSILVTTPLQCAGEEFQARALLPRLICSIVPFRWVGIVLSAVVPSTLFMLMHGAEDMWLNIHYFTVGMLMWWLAYRTGGIEASIALHVVNNLFTEWMLPFTDISGMFDRSEGTGSPVILIYVGYQLALVILVCIIARRKEIVQMSAPAAAVPLVMKPSKILSNIDEHTMEATIEDLPRFDTTIREPREHLRAPYVPVGYLHPPSAPMGMPGPAPISAGLLGPIPPAGPVLMGPVLMGGPVPPAPVIPQAPPSPPPAPAPVPEMSVRSFFPQMAGLEESKGPSVPFSQHPASMMRDSIMRGPIPPTAIDDSGVHVAMNPVPPAPPQGMPAELPPVTLPPLSPAESFFPKPPSVVPAQPPVVPPVPQPPVQSPEPVPPAPAVQPDPTPAPETVQPMQTAVPPTNVPVVQPKPVEEPVVAVVPQGPDETAGGWAALIEAQEKPVPDVIKEPEPETTGWVVPPQISSVPQDLPLIPETPWPVDLPQQPVPDAVPPWDLSGQDLSAEEVPVDLPPVVDQPVQPDTPVRKSWLPADIPATVPQWMRSSHTPPTDAGQDWSAPDPPSEG